MCDASDYLIGVVLGQRVDKIPNAIYYASRTLNDAQLNYSTIEKELLAVTSFGLTYLVLKLLFLLTMQLLGICLPKKTPNLD